MVKKRMHAVVHGRVQGVFFRDYTRRKALELNLTGWVRNLRDQTVETVFEGESENVNAMLDFLFTGSPHSHVTNVVSNEEQPNEGFDSFRIRY